ncbi:hypothetical protein CM50_07560 [Bacillus subtilis]|nr:hypothetical protein CM50_07560 [Bacillus subtilis] [Bacillus stercoris]
MDDEADHFLNEAAKISESAKLSNLPHSLFTYAKFLFKQEKTSEAIKMSKKGLFAASDKLFLSL